MAKNTLKRPPVRLHWTLAERLDYRTDKSGGPDACWPWMGHIDRGGYGGIWPPMARQRTLAHREAWKRVNGPIPPDKPHILHRCDNPACVNPAHLWNGTHQDNMADKVRKGRQARVGNRPGMACPVAKLTDDQVRAIRAMRSTMSLRQIAQHFGVDFSNVSKICLRKTWRHLDPPVGK